MEQPSLSEFLLTQTWTRMGEEARNNCCKIIDIGLDLPKPSDVPGMQRVELRDAYRKTILPYLMEFNPDFIFISAGFDAHKRDTMNFGYVGMIEDDYEWVTEQLVKVANSCCNGRIVSVLEGGYKIHGGIVSPFARSVASHVRSLADGGSSREMYSPEDLLWESEFERNIVEEKERRRQNKLNRLRAGEMERGRLRGSVMNAAHHRSYIYSSSTVGPTSMQANTGGVGGGGTEVEDHHDMESILKAPLPDPVSAIPVPVDSSLPASDANDYNHTGSETHQRKRRRNQVDYKELYEQMKTEGFTG